MLAYDNKSRYLFSIQIFIAVWFIAVLGINEQDINSYSIPRWMAITMANEGSFVLGTQKHNDPNPPGDLVSWNGKTLPFKQPGIAVIGGFPLYIIKLIDPQYGNIIKLAIATAFSTSIYTALTSALVFLLLSNYYPIGVCVFSALITGVGSTLTVYSGTIHHDPVAISFVFLGFYLFHSLDSKRIFTKLLIPGFLFGLSTFISLLPIGILPVLSIYIFLKVQRIIDKLFFVFGVISGFLPILIYQNHYFDSPLNTAGHIYSITHGTFILSNWEVIYERFIAYFSYKGRVSLLVFNPILVLGFIGHLTEAIWNKSGIREFSMIILSCLFAHAAYVVLIGGGNTSSTWGYGDCQYGPRYWIAAIPFMSLGIPSLFQFNSNLIQKVFFYCFIVFLSIWSILVNQAGLHFGHTYCGPTLISQLHDYYNFYQQHKNWPIILPNLIFIQALIFFLLLLAFPRKFLILSPLHKQRRE